MAVPPPVHRDVDVVSRSRNWSGPFRKTPDRLFGMGFIRLYQLTLSGFIGNSCRHMPTCSEYGYEAIARHGLWRGGWMTLFRVSRCGPGGTSGFDPVPEQMNRGAGWAPWRVSPAKTEADRASFHLQHLTRSVRRRKEG